MLHQIRDSSTTNPIARETDLYAPVRDYLVRQGYVVRGEVRGCDITAVKDDDLIIIELKRTFNLALLIQATQRQRTGLSVYIAIPRFAVGVGQPKWRGVRHLLRRLELGLILVNPESKRSQVEIVFHPLPFERKRNSRVQRAILQETMARSGDHNLGGSNKKPILTAYREQALFIAFCLSQKGQLSPKAIRGFGACDKTLSILYSNVYGWFERVERGVYRLKPKGEAALEQYADLVAQFTIRVPDSNH